MKKSFKTKFLPIFFSILMLFCMIPQAALADASTVIPNTYSEVEEALRSATPTTIEINGSFTLNNEVTIGANHTLSISSGSAIYLGSCKLNIPAETDLTVNGDGKLACNLTSGDTNTISVEGNLNLNGIDFEVYSNGSQIQSTGKLTATDCNIIIANSWGAGSKTGINSEGELEITGGSLKVSNTGYSDGTYYYYTTGIQSNGKLAATGCDITIANESYTSGIQSFGELKITGGSLNVSNIGEYTTGIGSFSDSPISISDCEVEFNSNADKHVTGISGNLYIKNSEVDSNFVVNNDYNSEAISYGKLTFDNSTVTLANSGGATGFHSYDSDSEIKIINNSIVRIQYQGYGTGISLSPVDSDNTASIIIDDSVLEIYPGGIVELSLNNGAQIMGSDYGKIIFHEDSNVRGISNKIKDRDVIVTKDYITVGPSSAVATSSAISAGTYTWDGEYFSNTTVPPTDITFTAVQTGGASGTADSTGINITFSEDVTGLTEDKISITDGTGAAVKGALRGTGANYTISLTSVSSEGTVNIDIANFGSYRVATAAQNVDVYKNTVAPLPTDITFTAVQTGGASGTADSTGINIAFSEDVTGLTEDKISITDGTGAAVKGALSGSGSNYTIALSSVAAEGTVNFSIADFGSYRVTTPVQTVNIYKNTAVVLRDISFVAVQTGGRSGTADSTGINIIFNEDVTGFTEDKISITNGTGAAVKGTLSGSGANYTISLTSVGVEGTVNLSIADFGNYRVVTPAQIVNIYKNTAIIDNPDSPDDSQGGDLAPAKTEANVVNGNTINLATKEADGILTSSVDKKNISDAIKKAEENKENPVVSIVADQKDNIDTIKIAIDNEGWKQIAQKDNMLLQIKAGSVILTLDNEAINGIYKQAEKDIIIQLGIADKFELTTAQQSSVGENQAYNLSISSDDKLISEFNGKVNVKLPYALKFGENADSVIIYHVSADGHLKIVRNASYNADLKTVDFNTSHFSIYMIDYNHMVFSDVTSGFWGKSAIDFSSARNLVEGTGNNRFEPDRAITRAEFTQMIYNVFEFDNIDYREFKDVKPGAWYYAAVMSCKKAGFFEKLNLSDDEFKPNQIITREEMAVILSNVARYCKITSSGESADLTKFSDYDNINQDFADNIIFAINLGLLDKNGIGNDKFDPKGSTTRAQSAQIQKNMMYILNITE